MAKRSDDHKDWDLLRLYLTDVGEHRLLTRSEEARLSEAIAAGRAAGAQLEQEAAVHPDEAHRLRLRRLVQAGDDARGALVRANLRLVVFLAKRYRAPGLHLLDLVQEGNLGLIRAAERFDGRKGFAFSTYAAWWIRQSIGRSIATTGRSVRLPAGPGEALDRLWRERADLEARTGAPATVAELAPLVQLTEGRVRELLRFADEPLSLDQPLHADGDAALGDMVADPHGASPFETTARAMLPGEVSRLMGALDERERSVLRLRYGLESGEPATLDQVGRRMNLSRERIRRLELRAMRKLRRACQGSDAREFLSSS